MKIEGAIFDLDGTLMDSMFIWDSIGEKYLLSRGIEPRENLNQMFKTMSLLQAAKYYQSEYGITDSTEKIMSDVNQMIEHLYTHQVRPKEGVKDFLEQLQKNNVKMCVASATDQYLVEAALKSNDMLGFFEEIFTCTKAGFGKDNPKIYWDALAHLNTDPEHTYIFEDALYAVKTAKSAGFHVVGVYDESESAYQESLEKAVDIYIHSFTEMRDYFD